MRRRCLPLIIFSLIPALLLGSCAHPGAPFERDLLSAQKTAAAYYQSPPLSGDVQIRHLAKSDTFFIQQVTLPQSSPEIDDGIPFLLDYYLPNGGGPFPLILISPILGGRYRTERSLAHRRARPQGRRDRHRR